MNKILNWVFGSFFRTLGRLLVFILIGFILAQFINFKDIKITDLFGFEKVNASSYYPGLVNETQTLTNTSTGQVLEYVLNNNTSLNSSEGTLKIKFNIIGREYIINEQSKTNEINEEYCNKWTYYQPSSGNNYYSCTRVSAYENYLETTNRILINSKYYFVPYISDSTGNWYEGNVDWENGYFVYNVKDWNITNVSKFIIFYKAWDLPSNVLLELRPNFTTYNTSEQSLENNNNAINNQTGAINNQTQQQHQDSQNTQNAINNVNDSLTNNNTSDASNSAGSFFDNFNDNDHGLSSIITAPLRAINAMLNDTCVAPGATYKGQSFSLPCGSMLWNREGGQDFRNFINIMYGGFLAYFVIRSLFLDIEKLKNPNNDKVEVESL